MSSAEKKNNFWRMIRIITAAPVLAMAALIVLWLARREVFSGVPQFWALIGCLGILPLLAYPLQRFSPRFQNQGRAGQRTLAMIYAFCGYLLSCLICVLTEASRNIWMFCLEYLLCGLGILVFNKVFHLKISGHICGIIGPMVLLVQNNLPAAILVGFIILLLVATASLKINRHTIPQMIGGGIVPLISFGILLLLFR